MRQNVVRKNTVIMEKTLKRDGNGKYGNENKFERKVNNNGYNNNFLLYKYENRKLTMGNNF